MMHMYESTIDVCKRHVQELRACLLYKLLAQAEQVPEIVPVLNNAIQPVCL